MRSRFYTLAILLAGCAPTYAQAGPTGTWRVESTPPWEVVLRADGSRLTGAVNSCSSVQRYFEIFDGKVAENAITFKCTSGDRQRTITFVGRMTGDEIAFTWNLQNQNPDPQPLSDAVFGDSAPRQFTVRRVAGDAFTQRVNDELARAANTTRGMEFAASVNLRAKGVKVEGLIFLPAKVNRAQAVIVVIGWGRGFDVYQDSEWRKLSAVLQAGLLQARITPIDTETQGGPFVNSADRGGGDGLLMLMERLAQESGHQELANAPLLLWAHSAAGGFGPSFASAHPDRTIGFITYHSGGRATTVPKALSQVPALFLKGGKDTSNIGDLNDFASSGRAVGAPWTFSLDPEATHGDIEYLEKAYALMIPWVKAVFQQRLSADGSTLRPITDTSAWMGNNQTGEVAPYGSFPGSKVEASWLPDELSARAWQALLRGSKPEAK